MKNNKVYCKVLLALTILFTALITAPTFAMRNQKYNTQKNNRQNRGKHALKKAIITCLLTQPTKFKDSKESPKGKKRQSKAIKKKKHTLNKNSDNLSKNNKNTGSSNFACHKRSLGSERYKNKIQNLTKANFFNIIEQEHKDLIENNPQLISQQEEHLQKNLKRSLSDDIRNIENIKDKLAKNTLELDALYKKRLELEARKENYSSEEDYESLGEVTPNSDLEQKMDLVQQKHSQDWEQKDEQEGELLTDDEQEPELDIEHESEHDSEYDGEYDSE